jgi:hypothetical protein
MIDRSTITFPWTIESLVRPDAPLVDAADCDLCKSGVPFTAARATVLSQ